jgi:hypothetical protein
MGAMLRMVLLSGLAVACAAICYGGDPGSRPATAPAANQPARPEASAETRARIERWVEGLTSRRYRTRREAREGLRKIINRPGVDEILFERLRTATDPEVRATLEELLVGFGEPVVMVWRRAVASKTGNSFRQYSQAAGAPSLLVTGTGEFVYDAASTYFTGKQGDSPAVAFRQGRLTAQQLWKLREMIADSGVARLPATGSVTQGATKPGVQVTFYLRSGSKVRASVAFWRTAELGAEKRPSDNAELALALAIRDFLAARPARPYEGPLALHAERELAYDRSRIGNLPEWPISGVDLLIVSSTGAVRLEAKELKAVREALAENSMFQHRKHFAFRVFLVPWLKEARELYYGGSSSQKQLRLRLNR